MDEGLRIGYIQHMNMSTAEILENKYAELYARAKRLDINATLKIESYDATITYSGYVDFYCAGSLVAHLKN